MSAADLESGRISQLWFAGVHSDIGGGYPDKGLAGLALRWIVEEAAALEPPLLFDRAALPIRPDALALQHDELVTSWRPWKRGLRRLSARDDIALPYVEDRFKAERVPSVSGEAPYRPEGMRHHPRFAQYY